MEKERRKRDTPEAGVELEEAHSPKRKKIDCPYLGSIKRHILDFDFEKQCSISLNKLNVYCCLVCGIYFRGRGKNTYAYMHSLEVSGHHLFINLHDQRVFCLPDNYEVEDISLQDLKHNLAPRYSKHEIMKCDVEKVFATSLDGIRFIPGCIGLNNIKANDYVNVIIQAICRIGPLRDYFLSSLETRVEKKGEYTDLAYKYGELIRKIWNPNSFKGHVSPHEVLQALTVASFKRFKIGQQKDPAELICWTLAALHSALTSINPKTNARSSVISKTCQGLIEVNKFIPKLRGNYDTDRNPPKAKFLTERQFTHQIIKTPFWMLTLDLPPCPLFKEQGKQMSIPQVPLFNLLRKFDGRNSVEEAVTGVKKTYTIRKLPKFLILHTKRIMKNNYFLEKNPTIVSYPIRGLNLSDLVKESGKEMKYDLLANVIHEGKPESGNYRVQIKHKALDEWYEIQDLHVTKIMPQLVALSESYLQIFELQKRDLKEDVILDKDIPIITTINGEEENINAEEEKRDEK